MPSKSIVCIRDLCRNLSGRYLFTFRNYVLALKVTSAGALSCVGALTWISVAVLGSLLRGEIHKFSARD